MRLEMRKGDSANDLSCANWALAIHGPELDERGRAAVTHVTDHTATSLSLKYDPDSLAIIADDVSVPVDDFPDFISTLKVRDGVVLEATTLGFVEVLLCSRAFNRLGITNFDILYVEPQRYRGSVEDRPLTRRDFELSSDIPGFQAIPGHSVVLDDRRSQRGVFFLGYEEARLRRAFEDLQMIRPNRALVVFGVPAFKAGWEMDAIANNIPVIDDKNIRGGLHFCGAENPLGAIEILREVKSGLLPGERMFVAPLGTKPHGIGVALFACLESDVGIIYDHPTRTSGRSDLTGHWHLFLVSDFTVKN